jgi:hypothetical protein
VAATGRAEAPLVVRHPEAAFPPQPFLGEEASLFDPAAVGGREEQPGRRLLIGGGGRRHGHGFEAPLLAADLHRQPAPEDPIGVVRQPSEERRGINPETKIGRSLYTGVGEEGKMETEERGGAASWRGRMVFFLRRLKRRYYAH